MEEKFNKPLGEKVSQDSLEMITDENKNQYKLEQTDSELFATYHAIYSNEDFDLCFPGMNSWKNYAPVKIAIFFTGTASASAG